MSQPLTHQHPEPQPPKYTLRYNVIPSETGDWQITPEQNGNGDVVVLKLKNGEQAVLIYSLSPDSRDQWKLAEDGTMFTKAEDNFNYNLNSAIAADNNAVTVTITAVNTEHTLTKEDLHTLVTTQAAKSCTLVSRGQATVGFRLVAKLANDNDCPVATAVRYFSQDPVVIIEDPGPG
ncbi:hypothetical protein ACSLBF_01165 [Pseudoalteromonas sp. T1lg65]|uniref:hypothetical protein n=1 Tax=Pseudoalteromonas sp. T1lg65 TaxID=2077101 RepID=UPI003F7A22A4